MNIILWIAMLGGYYFSGTWKDIWMHSRTKLTNQPKSQFVSSFLPANYPSFVKFKMQFFASLLLVNEIIAMQGVGEKLHFKINFK